MAQHRLNYHHLITQSGVSAAGPLLANAAVDAQLGLHYPNLQTIRRAYARMRLLRYFLFKQGIRDLGLPLVPPVAVPSWRPISFAISFSPPLG
jgi:hypothetical protein